MAGTATPIFPQTVKTFVAQIQNSDGTSKVTIATGATNGTKIESLNVTSTDGVGSRDLKLYMTVSGVDYLLGTISLAASSGNTNALPSIDILRNVQIPGLAYDSNGNRILYIANGATLRMAAGSTVTSGTIIAAVGIGGDF